MSEAGGKVGGRACVLRAGGFSCVLMRACVDAFVHVRGHACPAQNAKNSKDRERVLTFLALFSVAILQARQVLLLLCARLIVDIPRL